MAHTDIAKARAIKRAGHACEVCGTPVSFRTAYVLDVKPLFGPLFDPDESCVLCQRCWEEVEEERREGATMPPELLDDVQRTIQAAEAIEREAEEEHVVMQGPWGEQPSEQPRSGQRSDAAARRRQARREEAMRAAREAWFPPEDDDPDGGRCA